MTSQLESIPNVGPAVASKLERLGIARVDDLRGRDPDDLFVRLCALDGRRHDPCLLDTFVAVVSQSPSTVLREVMMEQSEHNPGEPEFDEHQEEEEAPHNPGEPQFGDNQESTGPPEDDGEHDA